MKLISIDNIYSKWFDCKINLIPYVNFVKELSEENVIYSKTSYYNYLISLLDYHKVVFDWIKNKEDCELRTKMFADIVLSIKKNGYKDEQDITLLNHLPYGKITYVVEDNKVKIVDGHHRMATLIYFGYKEFELKENYIVPIEKPVYI